MTAALVPDPAQRLRHALRAQQEGRWAEAEAAYRQVLGSLGGQGVDSVLLANWGQVLRRLGKDEEALAAYRWATAQPDAPAAVWFNLGNALFDSQEWVEAVSCLERALELDEALEPAAMQLARCNMKLGKWQEARDCFQKVLKANPANFSALLESGHLCQHLGTADEMLEMYRKAVEARPGRWLGHATLANALERQGRRDEAAVHYWRAQQCADSGAGLQAHRLIGRNRLNRGDAAGALEAFAHGLRCAPQDAESMIDVGDALMRAGDVEGAKTLFTQAGRCGQKEILARLGEVLFSHNHWEQAESVFRGIACDHPDDWAAGYNLAKLLVETWRMKEGLEVLDRAQALAGDKLIPGAESLRAAAAAKMGEREKGLDAYREAARREGQDSAYFSSMAMSALYIDSYSAQKVADLHRELFAPLARGTRAAFGNDRKPDRRLRIGYVTADMHHQHPVNLFMQPVLARHDADAFEISVYYTGKMVDAQTRQARTRVHRWRDVALLDDARLTRQIEADGIDILVDLMGHTTHNRRVVFAQRAAPVQATFLGYPASTGVPNIDWIVVDDQVAPQGSESLFSERLARLPNCVFCHCPEDDFAYPDYGPGHARRPLTFGSFNNITKLTGSTIAMWSKVLAAVPDSRLLLKAPSFMDPAAAKRFADLFAEEGLNSGRIEFRGPSSLSAMMAEYGDVDIALDAWPYNGGTTTYQALWMGVPVVTLAGEGFWQRMGASILHSIGRPEWVADTPAQFVKIAKQLAGKRVKLVAEKKSLRARMQASPALDIDRYVGDLEAQYRMMWVDWCERQPG